MFTAISAVSLNDLQPSTGTGTQSNTPGVSSPKQAPAPVPQTDTVKLSVTQQVRNLHSEGEGPGQIASSLGLDSNQVNGDLYVSLTWPQLLSKVASQSLGLAPAFPDASSAGSPAPGSAAATPAALIFPPSQRASEPAATATKDAPVIFPGKKEASVPTSVIFPVAKDAAVPAGLVVPGTVALETRQPYAPIAHAASSSKDAAAA